MRQHQLTAKLKAFGIQANRLRIDPQTDKTGYDKPDFRGAFNAISSLQLYCPPTA